MLCLTLEFGWGGVCVLASYESFSTNKFDEGAQVRLHCIARVLG